MSIFRNRITFITDTCNLLSDLSLADLKIDELFLHKLLTDFRDFDKSWYYFVSMTYLVLDMWKSFNKTSSVLCSVCRRNVVDGEEAIELWPTLDPSGIVPSWPCLAYDKSISSVVTLSYTSKFHLTWPFFRFVTKLNTFFILATFWQTLLQCCTFPRAFSLLAFTLCSQQLCGSVLLAPPWQNVQYQGLRLYRFHVRRAGGCRHFDVD